MAGKYQVFQKKKKKTRKTFRHLKRTLQRTQSRAGSQIWLVGSRDRFTTDRSSVGPYISDECSAAVSTKATPSKLAIITRAYFLVMMCLIEFH
jgi:hypothetical protein